MVDYESSARAAQRIIALPARVEKIRLLLLKAAERTEDRGVSEFAQQILQELDRD